MLIMSYDGQCDNVTHTFVYLSLLYIVQIGYLLFLLYNTLG